VSFTKGEPEVAEYRRVIGGFATGVAVVTSMLGDEPHGMTINSLTSVSLDPIIVFIALQRGTRTARAVAEHRRFVVNALRARGRGPLQEPRIRLVLRRAARSSRRAGLALLRGPGGPDSR
jgi:hypothetical protein